MPYITNLPVNNTFNIIAVYGQQGSLWKNGHKGIDITGENTLYSICDGEVTYTGYDKNGWGYYVSVKPNGFDRIRFILCHMVKGSIKVKAGDKVSRTTVLGTMGTTGNSSCVHVHVECRIDNTAVDPTPYLKVANKKATGLKDTDYKTTAEESAKILQQMLKDFDGVNESTVNYKALYEQEKAEKTKLEGEVKNLEARVSELGAKINAAVNILK